MNQQTNTNYYANGYLVTEKAKVHGNYFGVEGTNWPIDEDTSGITVQEKQFLINYVSENIDLSWQNSRRVDVCNDLDFVKRYLTACDGANLNVLILFCETNKPYPTCSSSVYAQNKDFEFIGFDYAYTGGSYYSCVYSDVFTKRLPQLAGFSLNKWGLFESDDELNNFIKAREKFQKELPYGTFEDGCFAIYKLWRFVGEHL